jgi:hypothetical protein
MSYCATCCDPRVLLRGSNLTWADIIATHKPDYYKSNPSQEYKEILHTKSRIDRRAGFGCQYRPYLYSFVFYLQYVQYVQYVQYNMIGKKK